MKVVCTFASPATPKQSLQSIHCNERFQNRSQPEQSSGYSAILIEGGNTDTVFLRVRRSVTWSNARSAGTCTGSSQTVPGVCDNDRVVLTFVHIKIYNAIVRHWCISFMCMTSENSRRYFSHLFNFPQHISASIVK